MFNSDDKVIQNADVRMNHIIDLYLNTPEKGCFDTPLHIASKFGFTGNVKVLAVYIIVRKLNAQRNAMRTNLFVQLAAVITCT